MTKEMKDGKLYAKSTKKVKHMFDHPVFFILPLFMQLIQECIGFVWLKHASEHMETDSRYLFHNLHLTRVQSPRTEPCTESR